MTSIGLVDVYLRGAAIGRSIELFAPAQDRESSAQLFLPLDRPAPVRSQLELVDPKDPSHKLNRFHVAHTIEVPTPATAERRGCWGYLRTAEERSKDQANENDDGKSASETTTKDSAEASFDGQVESKLSSSTELHQPSEEHPSQNSEPASSPENNDAQASASSDSNNTMKVGNSPRSSRRGKKGKRKKR